MVRLCPPDSTDWFIELLTIQDTGDEKDRAFARVVLSDGGHYAVASFRYLDVAAYRAIETPEGIRCARLEMLALSNLLRNPVIRPERIQTRFWRARRHPDELRSGRARKDPPGAGRWPPADPSTPPPRPPGPRDDRA